MKNLLLLLLMPTYLIAQTPIIEHSYISQADVYSYMRGMNPNLYVDQEIEDQSYDALYEWIMVLYDDRAQDSTFMVKDEDHVIFANLWMRSEERGKDIREMMLLNDDRIILKNTGDDDLLGCIEGSSKIGVAFFNVTDDESNEALRIFLVLLK